MTQLSEQQIRFFETFGFLKFPDLLTDCIEQIIADFEDTINQRGGQNHNGTVRSFVGQFVDSSEALSTLIDDPRILGIATSLVGDDFNYMGSDGNYYVGDTGWHSDGWHEHIRHVKIAFYLDPVKSDTGALRVIPGSHHTRDTFAQKCQGISDCAANWDIGMQDVPSYALESQPGDVVCFNHNLKHAAFGGGNKRRMFTMNLCQRYPEERLQELHDYVSGGTGFYGEAVTSTADASRMVHLEQVLAIGGHLAELTP